MVNRFTMNLKIPFNKLLSLVLESIHNELNEANEGEKFEANLAKRLTDVVNGNVNDKQASKLLTKIIGSSFKNVTVDHAGGLNQSRKIINKDGSIENPSDIGSTVTDITLNIGNIQKFLSVKYGNTLKISNIGISNWFKDGNNSCLNFFTNILDNPDDANNVATSFVNWFKANENNKLSQLSKIYSKCCKNKFISTTDINDFIKKCASWAKSESMIRKYDAAFSEFILSIDKNGNRNDLSRSMVATWLAALSREQYRNVFGRQPHNFQKNILSFSTKMNVFGYPKIESGKTVDIDTIEDYLFNKKHLVNEDNLEKFIGTCIGYGYWMVHGNRDNTIDVFEMTKSTKQ